VTTHQRPEHRHDRREPRDGRELHEIMIASLRYLDTFAKIDRRWFRRTEAHPRLERDAISRHGRGGLMAQQLSFARDIRPLFRDRDIQSMKFAFDLASYEDVRTHAERSARRSPPVRCPATARGPTKTCGVSDPGSTPARCPSARRAPSAPLGAGAPFLLTCERGACGRRNVGIRVGMTRDAPAALRRLGQ
jgi:hypothetical protein